MLNLSSEYYIAWLKITSPPLRYWIRAWQDGLHSGTPPEWAFSPFTIPCLAKLWELYSPPSQGRDRSWPQRKAIKILALQRKQRRDGIYFPCPELKDNEESWNIYWKDVLKQKSIFIENLYDSADSLLDESQFNPQITRDTLELLVEEFLSKGYTDYELFTRAGTGIIDPRGNREESYSDRILGLINHLHRGSTREFVARTEIVGRMNPLSNTAKRRIAGFELHKMKREQECGSTILARINNAPYAISRLTATHSITAFQRHRLKSATMLRSRSVELRLGDLQLAHTTLVHRGDGNQGSGWTHSKPKTAPYDHLDKIDPNIEPEAICKVIDILEDDPAEAIRILCDAFERQLGQDWPRLAGKAYAKKLRASLARKLLISIQETRDRTTKLQGNILLFPEWLEPIPEREFVDFEQVADGIRADPLHFDELLAQRFSAIAQQKSQFKSPACVFGWLHLAKGVRNRIVHAHEWPEEFRFVAIFLARVLLYVFASKFPREDK